MEAGKTVHEAGDGEEDMMVEEKWSWNSTMDSEVNDPDWSWSEDIGSSATKKKGRLSNRIDVEEKRPVDYSGKLNFSQSSSFVESEEDQETARELSELTDKWGVVKWSQFRGNKAEFWKEPAVRNVSHAVERNFLTKEFAASLLGIKNLKKLEVDENYKIERPVIAQDMVDLWGIVTKDWYKEMGNKIKQFWKETFVRKVLFAVQKNYLSNAGGAQLLGVQGTSVQGHRRKIFASPAVSQTLCESLKDSDPVKLQDVKPEEEMDSENNIVSDGVANNDRTSNMTIVKETEERCSDDPSSQSSSSSLVVESEEDRQTAEELLELTERWGVVKSKQFYRINRPFIEFWEEPAVKNVRIAVKLNLLTRAFGAGVLGIQKNKLAADEINTEQDSVIMMDMIDLWGVVKSKEFKGSYQMFWKELYVRKVLYAVQKNILTTTGAALLLGVRSDSMVQRCRKMFAPPDFSLVSSKSLKDSEELPGDLNGNDIDIEDKNIIWWVDLAPVNLDISYSDQLSRRSRTWIVFLQFSQLEVKDKKAKFNPYKAGKQEVADFLQYLQLTSSWPDSDHPDCCLASLVACLPDLSLPLTVVELLSTQPPTLALARADMKKNYIKHVGKWVEGKLLPVSPYDSTWSNFCQFSEKSSDVDPFLAEPISVRNFLVSKFLGKEMRLEEVQPKDYFRPICTLEEEPFFRPAYNFYKDNLDRLLSELDWHLQHSWLTGPLKDCQELELLSRAVVSCDERLLTDNSELKDLVLKISPNYSYSKVRTNHTEELFWGRKFTENILEDVRNKAVPVSVAASGLGVTSEMIWFAIKQFSSAWDVHNDDDNATEVMAVKDYVYLGYGSRTQYWKEQSILDLLEDVKNRNVSAEKLAALVGVSRREVVERCGGVKKEAEREAEKAVEVMEKMRQKVQEELTVRKKKSELELQIEMAEKCLESLSGYEKMRLKNIKERQALVESLDFDKEKMEIKALTPKNQPRQAQIVQLREKSARVKRRSEIEQLRSLETVRDHSKIEWMELQESRSSPKWFGHWIPRRNPLKSYRAMAVTDVDVHDVYDEETINKFNHVPKYELRAQELLEITPSYHKSRTLLDSCAADFKSVRAEEKLVTKTDWTKFELVQDSMVSTNKLTSLNTCNDYICFGTQAGGVGVALEGRAFTIRPHNRQVTRTLFLGSRNSPGILSAALDGTVRMTDLVQQSVCLEYSWDQSYSGKQGVRWLEERGVYSFLLDCGNEINQIDVRSKDAFQLFEVEEHYTDPNCITNLSVNPANKNLVSLCRDNTFQIWDLRRATAAMVTLPGPSGSFMAGGGWSSGGRYLVTCAEGGSTRDATMVYNGQDFYQEILAWEGPRKTGVTWCTWEESLFLANMQHKNWTNVAAIDCRSGEVVGELTTGLDNTSYLVHCSKSREVVVVGNNKGSGGLAVFKVGE